MSEEQITNFESIVLLPENYTIVLSDEIGNIQKAAFIKR
jgi:hypothetical protein